MSLVLIFSNSSIRSSISFFHPSVILYFAPLLGFPTWLSSFFPFFIDFLFSLLSFVPFLLPSFLPSFFPSFVGFLLSLASYYPSFLPSFLLWLRFLFIICRPSSLRSFYLLFAYFSSFIPSSVGFLPLIFFFLASFLFSFFSYLFPALA